MKNYRIYRRMDNDRYAYFVVKKRFLFWWIVISERFKYLSDAEMEIEYLKTKNKEELISEL